MSCRQSARYRPRHPSGCDARCPEAALDRVFVADNSRVPLVRGEQRDDYTHTTAGAMAQNVYLYCAS